MENYNGKSYGIYVYSTKTYFEKNWFKIGSTVRTFDERVFEQDVTAVPEPLEIFLTFSVYDYKMTPKELEDKLHDYFDNRGKRLRLDKDREWFYDITIDNIKDAIKAILVDPEAFKMRLELMPHQKEAYNFICDRFDAGSKNVLLNHKPRSGKTFICYQLLKEKKYRNVLLLTNYPVLNGQWKDDAQNIYGFNYDIINVCNETINEDIMFDERPNFVMVSFQDAKGKELAQEDNIPMLKKKFEILRGINWDLIIIDECHRGKESELTDKLLGHLNYDRLLGLSATPTRNLLRGTFAPCDIHTYNITDEKRYKKLYPELYTLPDISFYLYNPSTTIKEQMQYYKEEEFFTWNKFFQVENGKLKYKNDIEIFFKWISGFYGNNINMPLKKLSSDSILMFVQNNECQPLLVDVLNSIDFYKNNYNIHYTNSEINSNSTELLWKTKNVFIPRDGKKSIVIANRQLTTGITLRNCDMVMFMNDWASMDEYIQASYRCQSSMKGKDNCSVIDFTPYRTFKIFKEFIEVNYISGNKSLEERYIEFFDSLSIFECNEDGKFKMIDVDGFKNRLIDVMDISSRNYFNETLIKKDLISDNIDNLLSFGEMDSDVDRLSEDVRLDENDINKGKTKIIEKTFKSKKDIKEEENRYKIALENAKYILNKTLFMSLFTGCKIDDINSILNELESNKEIQKYYIDSLIGVDNIKFSDVVFIYKTIFDENLINDRIRTFNTKIRILIYTKNKYEKVINIEKVIDLINSYIGVSNVEKKLLGEVFTPFGLIEEMLDTLPVEVWSNPDLKWLDPANGIGNFPIVVVKRLMKGLESWQPDEELRYKHILENMIHVCDIQSKNMFIYLMLFDPNNEYKMNWHRGSFLDEGFDNWMKEKNIGTFKIVGNPPYNKGLYLNFIKKSIEVCDSLLYVVPSTFTINTREKKYVDLLKDNGLKSVKFLGFDSFDVNISTLYFNLIKGYNDKIKVNEVFLDRNENINNIENDIEHSILSKIDNFEKIVLHQGKNDNVNFSNKEETENIKFEKSDIFKIKMLSRLGGGRNIEYYYIKDNKDIVKSNKIIFPRGTANYNSKKNFKNLTRDFVFNMYVDDDIALSKSIMYIPIENVEQYENIRWYILRSKFVRYIFLKYNTFEELTKKIFNFIPKIDLSMNWSDEKLYKYFNLTEDEIKLIEETIK